MLHITPQQPPILLRGADTSKAKEVAKKVGFFVAVAGAITGFVWLASR